MNLNSLGIIYRSGCLKFGKYNFLKELEKNNIIYIFLANDAGNCLKKEIYLKVKNKISINEDFSSSQLSKIIGKEDKKILFLTKKGETFLKMINK